MLSIRNALKLEDTDKTLFIRVFLVSTRTDIWRTRHLLKFLLQHGSILPQSNSIELGTLFANRTARPRCQRYTRKFILTLATCHPATSVSDFILFFTQSYPPQPQAVLVVFTNQLFLQPRSVPSIIMHLIIKASCSCDFRFNGWAERGGCGWTPVYWKL